MAGETSRFHWVDYFVLALMLLFSSIIGLYFAFAGKKAIQRNKTTGELFLGGRGLTLFPVTMSVTASFVSGISALGTPAEMYSNGLVYMFLGLSYFIAFPVAAHVFVPILYRLEISSAHEYLRIRFGELVRTMASIVFFVQMLLYMAVVLYAPALALSQVSGIPIWASIVSVGGVSTIYTALGGLRAVVWTDAFQMTVLYVGLVVMIVIGAIAVGGPGVVFERALAGGRVNFLNFDPNPLERHTFWTLFLGGTFMVLTIYAANQSQIQRYLSCKDLRTAQLSLWFNLLAVLVILFMWASLGMVAYAYYFYCDPLIAKRIQHPDQVIALLVVDTMNYPGVPGLFLSVVFCATLSTISTGLNSMATVLVVDMAGPLLALLPARRRPRDATLAQASKWIAVLLGGATVGLAFVVGVAGRLVLQLSLSIFGMFGGPLLGIFTAGILFPWINSKGAAVGMAASIVVVTALGVGPIIAGVPPVRLPFRYDNATCSNFSIAQQSVSRSSQNIQFASLLNSTIAPSAPRPEDFNFLLRISYIYYALIATAVLLIVGLLVSMCTGFTRNERVPRNLYMKWLPDHLFGVRVYPQAASRAPSAHQVSSLPSNEEPAPICNDSSTVDDRTVDETTEQTKNATRHPDSANVKSEMENGRCERCGGDPQPAAACEVAADIDLVPLNEFGNRPLRTLADAEKASLDTGYGSAGNVLQTTTRGAHPTIHHRADEIKLP